MTDSLKKLIYLLWAAIAVLVVGMTAGGIMLVNKANQLQESNDSLTTDNSSLRLQLREVTEESEASGASGADDSSEPQPSATPAATASPSPTPTGTPNPNITPNPSSSSNR